MTNKTEAPQTLVGPLLQSFFMEHLCNHKRLSPQTVKSYRDTFRLLLQYLQAKMAKKPSALSITDLDAPVVLSFLETLEQQRHNQAQSRNVRLTAIRSFFRLVALRDPVSVGIATRVLAAKRGKLKFRGHTSKANRSTSCWLSYATRGRCHSRRQPADRMVGTTRSRLVAEFVQYRCTCIRDHLLATVTLQFWSEVLCTV